MPHTQENGHTYVFLKTCAHVVDLIAKSATHKKVPNIVGMIIHLMKWDLAQNHAIMSKPALQIRLGVQRRRNQLFAAKGAPVSWPSTPCILFSLFHVTP